MLCTRAPVLLASMWLSLGLHGAFARTNVSAPGELKKFTVTIRRLDPALGPASGQQFVLPVDSPDEEHAAASTLANAISFSK